MKTWIKTSIATAVAATVGLSSVAALARGGDCDGPRGGHHAMHRMSVEDVKERVEARLDKLQDALSIRVDQQGAWDAFRDTVASSAAQTAEHVQTIRGQERPATALERMERMEEFGQLRLEALQATRRAAQTLYASLDDAQKKTFDERFRSFGGHRMGPGGKHGGMGPGAAEGAGRS